MHVNGTNGHTKNPNDGKDHDYRANNVNSNLATAHWRERLATAIPTLFPLRSYSLPHLAVNASITRSFLVPDQGFILDHGITLSAILALAYGLVLRAHSDSPDEVVFGYIRYNERAGAPRMTCSPTSFVRSIVFNWGETTLSFLKKLQDDTIQSDGLQVLGDEHIVIPAEITSLFRTILSFNPTSNEWYKSIFKNNDQVIHDFVFKISVISSQKIEVEVEYASSTISKPEVEAFLSHFGVAMENIFLNLTEPLSEISLISSEEQRRLIVDINPPCSPIMSLSQADSVTELIEKQVLRTPQKIALQFNQDRFITYKELDSLANHLAQILISNGVKRGNLVGIYMDKCCEMFTGIIGIHKAAGAYVPLDPEHPPERLKTILRVANIRIVLTQKALQPRLESHNWDNDVLFLPVNIANLSAASKPNVRVNSDDISHVLFTSGSTGVPKGVVLTHGSIVESALASQDLVGRLDGRVLQFSNYTFDFSVWDWCCALSGGGTLCVAPKQQLIDDLSGVVGNFDITYLGVTPTIAALISPQEVPSLQMLLLGGEMVTTELRDTWADVVTLMNIYGPTETSTCVTAHKSFTLSTEVSNIGKPIGRNVIYILDERLRPVPLGCVGELFIGGPQVARGYLGDPNQTGKVFVKDPFRPGSIMYASGDLVRMSPEDYSINYLGRRDTQIKIHGLRVEIGEIETVLKAANPMVTNAVVLKADVGRETLVAFLEVPSDTDSDGLFIIHDDQERIGALLSLLRHATHQKLPAYMTPNLYVPLNRFPLSSSGKLDRKALHAFFSTHQKEITALHLGSAPPQELSSSNQLHDEVQATLRSLCALTLNLSEDLLNIDDDFFTLGGDSVSAIRLAGAARTAGLSLPASAIIHNPTIRRMAQLVQSATPQDDYDDDETPTVTFDKISSEDLTLLKFDQDELDSLRNGLLPAHGLSASDVLDIYPTTALQASFLMAGLTVNQSYMITLIWDLPPKTDSLKLAAAFDYLLNHPNGMMLRTVFMFNSSLQRWLQVLIRSGRKNMNLKIATVKDEAELDLRVRDYEKTQAIEPFGVGELLTRSCVFQVNGYARVLVWTVHHALLDHWSLKNLVSDIECVYANHPLPHRRSFKPMIKYLEHREHNSDVDFWRRHLHNAPSTPLPFAHRFSSNRGVIADQLIFRDIDISDNLLSRRYGIMMSTVVTCAWSIVLSAHSGTADVVFGQILAGRNAPIRDIESMSGVTINTVPRRVVLNPEVTVLEMLHRIQSDQLEISKHEAVSLADLQSQDIPVFSMFNTLLNFRNTGYPAIGDSFRQKGVLSKPRSTRDRADYPFGLDIDLVSSTTISTTAHYASSRVAEMEAHTLINHFESALRFILEHPKNLVGDVGLINNREMRLLLSSETETDQEIHINGMNGSHFSDSRALSVHNMSELIELQVEKTPRKIAIQFGHDVFLTYLEMDSLSNCLARKLISNGVEKGNLVALYMDKSVEMFLAILAVHKAGGAYVPLDPEHPPERINTIFRLSQSRIALVTKDLQNQLATVLIETEVSLMVIDSKELHAATKPDVCVNRDDICHVLFTSGSTGIPKGVVLPHGPVIENTLATRDIRRADGRVLQFGNYTFDFCVSDWACTFSSGGTLCFVSKDQTISDIGGVARSLDITTLGTTPTVVGLTSPEEIPYLQIVIVGGEVLTSEVRNKWADEVKLMNLYGPSETCISVSGQQSVTMSTEVSNIGRPFGLNVIYLLDDRLRPVPLGCVGELYIGGPQLAQGYLGDPAQTAKAFVANPFLPGCRMYRTGDLGRMSPIDHSINYLGRRDTQIKIHGLRIEIGEIEIVLTEASEEITNAAVMKMDVGRETLVAFLELPSNAGSEDLFIVNDEHRIATLLTSVRRAARQKLPTYMSPNIYVPLNRFPLSSSGKLDRKALDAFFYANQEEIRALRLGSEPFPLSSSEAPHSELQAMLRSLWASTLGLDNSLLGIDDDFFMVGGDSVSAIRLAASARAAGLSLPAPSIIRNPTIRQMSQLVQSSTPHNDYDDEETPSITLDRMRPEDLTLMKFDQDELDSVRNDLLLTHNIAACDVLDVYPTTALQKSFLMAGLLVPNAYIMAAAWDLSPGTDTQKLQEAFGRFIDHPNGTILRTMFLFRPVSNQWLQVLIRPGLKQMGWTVINVADDEELELRLSEYQQNRCIESFGARDLLTRACIFQLNGCARVLVWTLHHALMDGWSLENMTFDIEQIYMGRSFSQRRPFKTMIKYLQYLDPDKGVEFWKKHLLNASPTPLPTRRLNNVHRVAADGMIFREDHIDLSPLTRCFGIMPSTLIICAWSIVLSAHIGTTDVLFGQILAGRNAPVRDIESMTGVMINTVPRRVILSPEATVLETLQQIQSDQIEIGKHENVSLTELQSAGIPISNMFNTLLNFKNNRYMNPRRHDKGLSTGGIFSTLRTGRARLDYPFALDVDLLSGDAFSFCAYFDPESISGAEVYTLLDHLGSALSFMIKHPKSLIRDVGLINDQETKLLLSTETDRRIKNSKQPWACNDDDDDDDDAVQSVPELIKLQVEKTPQKIALQFSEDVFLTYKQMDSLSNCLARKLILYGVEKGNIVGLYMDKSIELFLSILALHKAGAAYVPLDPEHPAERVTTIIRLSHSSTILTTKTLQSQLASILTEVKASLMAVDFRELDEATNPDVCLTRDDICHVLFTSGSTGTPKGVVLTHGSIIESAVASRDLVGRLNGRVLQFSNYTFDFSVWDWCCTLSGGGTLCIVSKQILLDDLSGITRNLDITYLGTTPTVAALISPQEVPSLQMLLLGGEMVTTELRDTWADVVALMNIYGPTETSTCVTAHKSFTLSTEVSNIGRPIGRNVIYILDERLRPVPLGCVGELFIGGPQVARGYLGDPNQTGKVFVKDPFRPGSIMYASGDLVRMSPEDYSINYLGRRDTQIKIHGLRVEIGEIETVLKAANPMISNAVVIKADAGRETLVAFLEVPSDTDSDDLFIIHDEHRVETILTSMRRAARQKLPTYMSPNIYVPLNRFPLSSSGKLDRKALGTFFQAHQKEINAFRLDSELLPTLSSSEAPHNELQAMLRSLWASTLNLNEYLLGIDDDFFAVGGDSVSAIWLAGAARSARLSLPVTTIIRNPTIRKMAQFIQSAAAYDDHDDDETPSVSLDRMDSEDLSLVKLDRDELDLLRNDLLPHYGLTAGDVLDVYPTTPLQTSFLLAGTMVKDAYMVTLTRDLAPKTDPLRVQEAFHRFLSHPNGMMLRTVFVWEPLKARWLQILIRPEKKQLKWKVVVVANETELDLRVTEYARAGIEPFDDGELLTSVCIFQLDGYARVIVWTVHHALVDHWSLEHMISDVECIYANRPLPHRRPFKTMIKYLQRLDRDNGVKFWRRHLHNASLTPFPQNYHGSRPITTDGVIFRDLSINHSSLTRRFGIMPSTLITCAWSIVLSAHSGTDDVVFGQVLAGRSAPIKGVETMTGVMINTVPRRVILDPEAPILETLQRIQSQQLEISKHESISLAELKSAGIPVSNMFNTILNFWSKGSDNQMKDEKHMFAASRRQPFWSVDYLLGLDVEVDSVDGLSIHLMHPSDIISVAEVNVILNHFESALRSMIESPQKPINQINLINERELRLLIPHQDPANGVLNLHSPNPTYPLDHILSPIQNVSQLIEMQVERTPQRIALQFGHDVFLTYRQMDSLSNCLARKLISNGVEKGSLVALYMDKSVEMFLAILAVHKAGGAYVPLDPEYPPERINTIFRLSQSRIALVTKDLQNQLANIHIETAVSLMVVDSKELDAATKPDVCVNRDDICHVLFTSGSTGIPKGVVLPHGPVIENTLATRDIRRADGRVLQFGNYTFDFCVSDWACTFSSGGTLCFVSKDQMISDIGGVARSLDITTLGTTPTVVGLTSPEEIPYLQIVIVGGEVLTSEVRNKWADEVKLMNLYGPSETCISVSGQQSVTMSTEVSNIGRPFGLNVIYLLDDRLRPVPLGCVGELYIGGPQLAQGYLGDPAQTAKAFVANPFLPGCRMYRTGDLGRMSSVDYSINYLGRRDTQIKIHGLRIETGEIEIVLTSASADITNAAVMKMDVGRETLVAFLELSSNAGPEDSLALHDDKSRIPEILASIRRATRQKLPGYMVPTVYVPLNRFPLTSSGKLDRKALAIFFYAHEEQLKNLRLDSELFPELSSADMPNDEMEATLRSLWASTLSLKEDSLGIDDDFFIVGGDSVSAIRLAGAARVAGLSLPVAAIVRNPTIRKMARIVQNAVPHDDHDDENPSVTLEKMRPGDLTLLNLDDNGLDSLRNLLLPSHGFSAGDVLDVYPATFTQTSQLLAGQTVLGAYISHPTWDLHPGTDVRKLQQAFDYFLDHSNGMMLRTVFLFEPTLNKWLQVLIKPGARKIKWKTVTVAHEKELGLRVAEYHRDHAYEPFGEGELLTRVCVFQLDGYARAIVWTVHHALMDRWFIESMKFDIERAYYDQPLPPRRPFKSLIKYLEGLDRNIGIEFWRGHLRNAPSTFFFDRSLNANRVGATTTISRTSHMDYRSLTRRFGIMTSTLVICAWSVVLSRRSGNTDVVFGQVLAGRNAPVKDIDSMVGIMINTVPRRVVLDPQITVLETLQQVQTEQIEIGKHENITLGELQSEGIPVFGMFDSVLNFRNRPLRDVVERDKLLEEHGRLFDTLRPESQERAEYPLILAVDLVSADTMSLLLAHPSEIISEGELQMVLEHFESVVRLMIDHPEKPISDIGFIQPPRQNIGLDRCPTNS